jgi:galactosyl transferase GMA12/MNN10 family
MPVKLLLVGILLVVSVHRMLSSFAAQINWALHPLATVQRTCPAPGYPTMSSVLAASASSTAAAAASSSSLPLSSALSASVLSPSSSSATSNTATTTATTIAASIVDTQQGTYSTVSPRDICITTLTDEKHKSLKTRYLGWRNFDGVLGLTWNNKVQYARKHGYRLFDESPHVDTSRPPAWSKIKAAQRLLTEEGCQWVFWLDADTVIMNSNKKMEDFLPATTASPSNTASQYDLLTTADDGGGYNSGAWIVRNSPWGLQFLDDWWNMKSFIKTTGFSKCGDNHAMKHLLGKMTAQEFDQHVLVPPRCTFNSFVNAVLPSQYNTVLSGLHQSHLYMNEGYYHKGDFIVHLAGYDNKIGIAKMLLDIAV